MSILSTIKKEYKHADTWLDFIKYMYWHTWPYDWRPGQVYYRLIGFCWYRYTTVKPRTLKYHTWCDRDCILTHMMFEILSQFLEEECSPGIVDWEGSNHRITYGGHSRNVQHVMWHLYYWWKDVYLVKAGDTHKQWHTWRENRTHNDNDDIMSLCFNTKWKSEKDKEWGDILFKRSCKKEDKLEKELNENMKTIVDLIPYLWT